MLFDKGSQINYNLGGFISLHYFVIRFPMCLTLLCLPAPAPPNNRKTHDLEKLNWENWEIKPHSPVFRLSLKSKYNTPDYNLLSHHDKKTVGDEYLSAGSVELNISKYKHHPAQYSPWPPDTSTGELPGRCQVRSGLLHYCRAFHFYSVGSLVQSDKNTIELFLLPSLKLSARCYHSLMTNNSNIFPRMFICTNDTV